MWVSTFVIASNFEFVPSTFIITKTHTNKESEILIYIFSQVRILKIFCYKNDNEKK